MGILSALKRRFPAKALQFINGLVQSGYSFENNTLASNETIFAAISILSNDIASNLEAGRQPGIFG